jgi:riboflavin synthase
MFTGIVQGLCPVLAVQDDLGLRRLEVELGALAEGLATGASVAVNGTCLTATAVNAGRVRFDVIPESLHRTNLARLEPGDQVNVERSMRVGDEIGGHLVSGHVSGVATVSGVEATPAERNLRFRVPAGLIKYLMHKGFVALDGASLTIAHVDRAAAEFGVCLIPETVARTTHGSVSAGDLVNLEIDPQTQTIVDTVERVLAERM